MLDKILVLDDKSLKQRHQLLETEKTRSQKKDSSNSEKPRIVDKMPLAEEKAALVKADMPKKSAEKRKSTLEKDSRTLKVLKNAAVTALGKKKTAKPPKKSKSPQEFESTSESKSPPKTKKTKTLEPTEVSKQEMPAKQRRKAEVADNLEKKTDPEEARSAGPNTHEMFPTTEPKEETGQKPRKLKLIKNLSRRFRKHLSYGKILPVSGTRNIILEPLNKAKMQKTLTTRLLRKPSSDSVKIRTMPTDLEAVRMVRDRKIQPVRFRKIQTVTGTKHILWEPLNTAKMQQTLDPGVLSKPSSESVKIATVIRKQLSAKLTVPLATSKKVISPRGRRLTGHEVEVVRAKDLEISGVSFNQRIIIILTKGSHQGRDRPRTVPCIWARPCAFQVRFSV